ncbi:MAG: DUF4281 domain-containing protein [Proteobacteria bacterium]|nr:DUF4281 domain-containing protein [Pseudomonadota bacterium]
MSAETVFSIANLTALSGWLVLALGIILRRPLLHHVLAGLAWPIALSVLYSALIIFFFADAPGGFDSLANVKLLFSSDWAALAGWVHYLAFDLFIGAWIARQVLAQGLPRLILMPLLPLTFLFGPAGFLAWHATRLALSRSTASSN